VQPRAAVQVLLRLKLSNAQVEQTACRAAAPPLPPAGLPDRELRRWLSALGPAHLPAVARLDLAAARTADSLRNAGDVVTSWRRARAVVAARPPLAVGDLAVDGRDLIRLGLRPGPKFGEILGALLEWVLDDPSRNGRDLLLERAARLAGEEVGDG
jgi:tRNA nucleotidyltransferase (CCA-adding enzyme)